MATGLRPIRRWVASSSPFKRGATSSKNGSCHGTRASASRSGSWDWRSSASGWRFAAASEALSWRLFVALFGLDQAASWNTLVDALLAAAGVGLVWVLMGRLSVRSAGDRLWITVLFGLSTQVWWVTVRGGVWHTDQLFACLLILAALVEAFGKSRPLLLGLLAGAAFLTRAPLAFAIPFFAWMVWQRSPRMDNLRTSPGSLFKRLHWARGPAGKAVVRFVAGALPFFVFFLWYNWARF